MTTTSAIAAWEAEGLRLLSTSAKAEVLAELRAAAERIALASRARSAPGFDRCAALVCAFLGPPELGVVATCSKSMKRIAREDHLWQPLIRRFSCVEDLRRAGSTLTGFRGYARLVRLWNHPDLTSSYEPPGMEAYSLVLEIKVDEKRVAGGVYELEKIRDDSAWAGEGFGFYDFDPHGRLTPSALEYFTVDDILHYYISVSVCVVRKSDKKCLHLFTDNGISDYDEESLLFDNDHSSSSFNDVDVDYRDWRDKAYHNFRLYEAAWDDEMLVARGFVAPYGELRLWDPASDFLPTETILKRWHASKNWV